MGRPIVHDIGFDAGLLTPRARHAELTVSGWIVSSGVSHTRVHSNPERIGRILVVTPPPSQKPTIASALRELGAARYTRLQGQADLATRIMTRLEQRGLPGHRAHRLLPPDNGIA